MFSAVIGMAALIQYGCFCQICSKAEKFKKATNFVKDLNGNPIQFIFGEIKSGWK